MLPLTITRLSIKPSIIAIIIFSLTSITGAQAASHNQHADIPIRFATGQVSTTVSGKLNPKQHERWYQFSATGGQYAVINITPLAGKGAGPSETANVGVLHMPNGQQDGTKGGIIYQGCLPVSGKYRLRIARNLMATQGKTAGYTTEIIILPKYASQSLCE